MTHIDNIEPNQIAEWEHNWTPRFLAIPFENDARNPTNHSATAELIQNMVREATGVEMVHVVAPVKSHNITSTYDMPNTFLVYKITAEAVSTMIDNRIWATEKLTFHVIPLDPTIPRYLFALGGFTTMDLDIVQEIVRDHWTKETTLNRIASIIEASADTTSPIKEDNAGAFIDSLTVERVDMKAVGGVLTTCFTILADGPVLKEDTYWYKIRSILSQMAYTSHMNGTGTVLEALHCNICHTVDHPRGLCPFLNLPGWKGPKHRPETLTTIQRAQGGSYFRRWGNAPGRGRV